MLITPTLSELITRVKGDLNARMGNSNALVVRSLAWVIAHVLAGVAWGIYQTVVFLSTQMIPDTATGDYLLRWATLFLGAGKVPASKATGTVIATAIGGSTIIDGTLLVRDGGAEYEVTGGPYVWAPGPSSQKDVTVRAVVAGAAGNYEYAVGAQLTFSSPPVGVQASAPLGPMALPAGFTGGADEESDDELQERIRLRLSSPPQGGAIADYEAWAQAADASVDRVWVQAWPMAGMAHGQVTVRFVVEGTGAGVLPGAGTIAAVLAYITARKPVTAELSVPNPSVIQEAITISITVHGDGSLSQADTYAAILAEIESAFRERAEVNPAGSTFYNSYLQEAVGNSAGVDWFEITAVEGGAGTDDIALGANEYPTIVIGGITQNWV